MASKTDLEDLLRRLGLVEKDLRGKLDCDLFDNEIAGLRAMIGNIEPDEARPQVVTQMPVASGG